VEAGVLGFAPTVALEEATRGLIKVTNFVILVDSNRR
jgi:hypothetical protein